MSGGVIRLPSPPEQYSRRDQAELRRAIATFLQGVQGLAQAGGGGVTLPIAESDVTSLVADLALKAPLASPNLTGNPTAPTAAPGDNDTSIATTAFVTAALVAALASYLTSAAAASTYAPLVSPALSGNPTAPTATPGDNDTSIATTAFVAAAIAALGAGLQNRATATITTASLADAVVENGTKDMGYSTTGLVSIAADRACRVCLYATSAARTADATRPVGTQASAGLGILAEFVFTAAATVLTSPIPFLSNGDGGGSNTLYYAITNRSGSTHTVQVDLSLIPVEL